MDDSVAANFLRDAISTFRNYKKLAERALRQVSDSEFFLTLDPEANSMAVIVKHISGNMISRWRDFLTSDGEKPDRRRDTEFVVGQEEDRDALMSRWESAWEILFKALDPLHPGDLGRTVLIRGERYSVVEAINRQVTHYAYHVGQIVFLAKHLRSDQWKSLSIPRNRSNQFNAYLEERTQEDSSRINPFDTADAFSRRSEEA